MPIRIPIDGSTAASSLGLAAGIVLAIAVLLVWRVPTAPTGAGAAVTFTASPSGELAVSQSGAFLKAPALIPSSPDGGASGQVIVTNQSPVPLAVQVRVLPATEVLDDVLQVKLSAGDAVVYRGSLSGLRAWSSRVLVFASGAAQVFTIRTWIPLAADAGWRGQRAGVSLQLKTRAT